MSVMQYCTINRKDENMALVINRSLTLGDQKLCITECGHSFPYKGKKVDTVSECFQFHFVAKGVGLFKNTTVCSGCAFLVIPGESQQICIESDDFEQYWINFSGIDVKEMLYSFGMTVESQIFDYRNDNARMNFVLSLFKSIFSSDEGHIDNIFRHNHNYLVGLLYQILSSNYTDAVKDINSARQYVSAVCLYIKSHYSENLTIEWLSATVGLSPKYLVRIFKHETGMTMIQYLTNIRLEIAKKLLTHTDKSVSDISEIIGYRDPLYFSKVFRANIGFSPSAFRKNI